MGGGELFPPPFLCFIFQESVRLEHEPTVNPSEYIIQNGTPV